MTFSSELKTELCKVKAHGCCAFSELYGIFLFSTAFKNDSVFFSTDRSDIADRVSSLLKLSYKKDFKRIFENGRYCFLADIITIGKIYIDVMSPEYVTDIFVCENCFSAFLRGAYLSSGTASDPEKDFHIEIKSKDEIVAVSVQTILTASGFNAHISKRNGHFVVYCKGSESVSDFITLIGGQKFSLMIIDKALERELRNKVNRIQNCENANLDKTVNAAVNQTMAINKLKKSGKLNNLSEELRFAAEKRLENPEMSLSELARVCSISRSGLNHRLNKLIEISKEKD